MTADNDLTGLPLWALEREAATIRTADARADALLVARVHARGLTADAEAAALARIRRGASIRASAAEAWLDQLDAAIRDRRRQGEQ